MSVVQATMGIKAFYYAPVNSANPKVMPTSGWKKLDVYQESCTFVDKDPTVTTHKSETSSKKITVKTKEGSELKLSIMDPSIDELVVFEGGTKTEGAAVSYKEPETAMSIDLAFKVLPAAGIALNIPCAAVISKKNTTYSQTGITLLDVTIEPTYGIEYNEDTTEPETTPEG